MNPTPCPECNRLRWENVCHWIGRDYAAMRENRIKLAAHEEVCPIINGNWYKSLWTNAQIGRDIYIAEYEVLR